MRMYRVSRWSLMLMSGLVMISLGCAQEVGDIDRTQANALRKADFTGGEWYIRQTFGEVPPATFGGFVGLTSDMEKIRWEITEDYLIAYRSYENNPGAHSDVEADPNGVLSYLDGEQEGYSDEYKESPVAAYPIISHFDVQRSYNASTGEQSNVIVENSSDRLWYDREWFRVDWNNELETGVLFDNFFSAGIQWYVQPSEPSRDALRMEYWDSNTLMYPQLQPDDYENGDLWYMDFTNRVVLNYGYTYCFGHWYPDSLDDCAASEVETVTSLLRVPARSEYEPIFYDDIDQQKFGFFRTERLVYDRRFGERLSNQILLGNRHNIWDNTWQRDGDGNVLRDANGRALARPMAERTARSVVYHVSRNYPEALWGSTNLLADEWDQALRRAVAAVQGRTIEEVPRMFIACHNPVIQEDPVECGEVGVEARVGDLRFNFIYWVDTNQMSGPLGYGPSSADPETGQIISGTAFVYGAAVDTYAEYALELVQFLNGDLDIEGLLDADFIRAQLISRANPNVDPRGRANYRQADSPLTNTRIEDINVREMVPESAQRFFEHVDQNGLEDFVARPEVTRERWRILAESGMGALGVDDEVLRGFGVESLDELPEEIRDRYFAGGALLPTLLEEGRDRLIEAGAHNVMLPEALDDTIVGLAMAYRGRTDYDQIYLELRSAIYEGVMEHEVGHTLGLRHNFQGSYDSINYHDFYWRLKTEGVLGVTDSGQIDIIPFRVPRTLADIYGMADITPAQVEGRMREFQYSSIMDYSSAFNTDIQGIGKYDEAAILYAYTTGRDQSVNPASPIGSPDHPLYNSQERGYVEVFDWTGDARPIFQAFEGLDSPGYTDLLEEVHYSTIASAIASDTGANTLTDALNAGYAAEPNPQTVQDRIRARHLQRFDDILNMREAEIVDRPVEVPYMFLSDYWVGARQSSRQFDQGADPLEQATNMIERYRTYYPFEYFRRDRLNWYTTDIFSRLGTRYFIPMVDNYQRWLFNAFDPLDDVISTGWMFGAFGSLNLMAEVMTTPSYGSYTLQDGVYYLNSYAERAGSDLYVAPGEGRRPYSAYDVELGYNYWVYPREAGQFWAHYAAVIVMSSSTSLSVRGADVGADFLSYSVPPYLVFEDEMTALYNGLFLQDQNVIGPRVLTGEDGKHEIAQRLFAPIALTSGDYLNPETGAVATDLDILPIAQDGQDVGPVVDVSYGFSQGYYPLLYGMAFFTSNFSLHYQDQGRVFRVGSGETFTPGEGFEVVTFCDPYTAGGECYGALQVLDENPDQPGIQTDCTVVDDEVTSCRGEATQSLAAQAVLRAQAAVDAGEPDYIVEDYVEDLNILRGMYDYFGIVL